jgi:hypothetical protein
VFISAVAAAVHIKSVPVLKKIERKTFHNTMATLCFNFSIGFYAHSVAFMLRYDSFHAQMLLRCDAGGSNALGHEMVWLL